MIYKFYKCEITPGGYRPQGQVVAMLEIAEEQEPKWSEVSAEFQELCMHWFENPTRMGKVVDPEPLKPYSEEAIEHLSKHQLPSQGFMMVKVQEKIQKPQVYGYGHPFYSNPRPDT